MRTKKEKDACVAVKWGKTIDEKKFRWWRAKVTERSIWRNETACDILYIYVQEQMDQSSLETRNG